MKLHSYMLILFAVVLLTGAVWSSSAGGTEDAGTSLFANNVGDTSTSLMAVAGSLLDLVTGPSTDSGPLPISDAGPVRGGTIYQAPGSDPVKNHYTILASAGGGGTVYPSGQTSVTEGEDLSFTITPDSGYEISAVLLDGENAGALTTYLFPSVCADHQLDVRFRAIPESGNAGVVDNGETGALDSGLEADNSLVSEGLGSVSKTATITIADDPLFYTEGGNKWQVRKAHTIRNPHDSAQTDYMVRFIVHRTTEHSDSGEDVYAGNLVQSDYRDLRFTTVGNSPYDYHFEEVTADQATVWVTIPSLAANEGIQMYVYYGCPEAASAVKGYLSQPIFEEDFETSTSAWTVDSGCTLTRIAEGSGYVGRLVPKKAQKGAYVSVTELADLNGDLTLEYDIKTAQTNRYVTCSAFASPTSTNRYGACFWLSSSAKFYTYSPSVTFGSYAANRWYNVKLVFKPSRTYDVYVDNVLLKQNVAFYGSGDLSCIHMRGADTYTKTVYFDNIRLYRAETLAPAPDEEVHYDWNAVEYEPIDPNPAFQFSPNPGIVYLPVFFTDQSTGLILERQWVFGDGSTATNVTSVSHTYLSEGERTVDLQIRGLSGDWQTASHAVNVIESSGITWNGTISVKTVMPSGTHQIDLTAGLHDAATDGYDSDYDEYTGFPELDKTNAALDTIYLKQTKKIIPYGSSATWTMNIDVPAGKTATVTWTREPMLSMEVKEESTIKTSGFTAAAGSHTYTVTVRWEPYSLSFRPGWNMISLPVVPADGRVSVVLSGVTSGVTNPVRTWQDNAFVPVTTMQPKKGYWAHSNTQVIIPISGTTIPDGSYSLSQGWNMVGTPGATSLDIASISEYQVPERPAQTWSGTAFTTVTELEPGKAAWVFVTQGS